MNGQDINDLVTQANLATADARAARRDGLPAIAEAIEADVASLWEAYREAL